MVARWLKRTTGKVYSSWCCACNSICWHVVTPARNLSELTMSHMHGWVWRRTLTWECFSYAEFEVILVNYINVNVIHNFCYFRITVDKVDLSAILWCFSFVLQYPMQKNIAAYCVVYFWFSTWSAEAGKDRHWLNYCSIIFLFQVTVLHK